MVSFLFWNTGGRRLEGTVARLARRHEVDVLMLAECPTAVGPMLLALNAEETAYRFAPTIEQDHPLKVYVRFSEELLAPLQDAKRLTIRELRLPGVDPVILVVAHAPSKLWMSPDSQHEYLVELAATIRSVETRMGHSRTILVGDLNANPFEPGMIGAAGLHAVMTRRRALRGSRRVQDRERPYFYNPMWGRFGDASHGPPGTCHYDAGGYVSYFWNVFDQVLVRPGLLPGFRSEDVEVLTEDGEVSFLAGPDEAPDREQFSDHLPLLFGLSL
jgi:hypothetical protein